MFPGKPCHFVDIGNGCNIYENRPQKPCIEFKCEWLINPEIPDYLRPASSGVIIVKKYLDNTQYLFARTTGTNFDENLLSWIIQYGSMKFENVAWQLITGEIFAIGAKEFLELVEVHLKG